MNRAPVVGAVTDLQPARVLRVDHEAGMADVVRGALAEIHTRVANAAPVRHLLTRGDVVPDGTMLQSLVSRLAPRTGHTLQRVVFAHDSSGDTDLRWTCECGTTGWGWMEARAHYLDTQRDTEWRTREPLRIRRGHPTGVHGLSVTLQDHPDGSTTRMVVVCDCGWFVVGVPGGAVQAAAWALAHRTVADRDPYSEPRHRDEHQTLVRLSILSMEEHELRDLPRAVSEMLAVEAACLVDEIRAGAAALRTPVPGPDDHARPPLRYNCRAHPLPTTGRSLAPTDIAAMMDLPEGWVDIGYTRDTGFASHIEDQLGLPVVGQDELVHFPTRRSTYAFTVGPRGGDDLANLDRFANTAAGIRARLAEIDAADRAGQVGGDTSPYDGASWRAEHATEADPAP